MKTVPILASAILVVLAGSTGYAGGNETGRRSAPPAEVRVDTVTRIKTETVEVESVPQSCLDAIEHAREGFSITVEFTNVMVEFLAAAGEFDVVEMNRQTRQMDPLTEQMGDLAPQFRDSAAECEAASD